MRRIERTGVALALDVLVVALLVTGCEAPERAGTAWSATPSLRIGSAASGGPDQFGRIGDIVADHEGRIYVLDALAREVRVFARDGSWIRTMGRRGGGPGELELPSSLDWGPEGGLWIADSGNHRFQVYDAAGRPRESHPYAPQMYRHGDVWGPDDLLYTFVARRGPTFVLDLVRRRLRDGTLMPVDTLPVPTVQEGRIEPLTLRRDGRTFSVMVPVPLQATSKRLLVPGRGWWLSHPGEVYRLARIDFEGDTLLRTGRPYDAVPVTDEDVRRALDAIGREARMDREWIPERHPPVQELARLPDGHLLVRRRLAVGRTGYDVFDPKGVFLGSIEWEGVEDFRLDFATDSTLYGTYTDDLGLNYAMRIDIERRDSGASRPS